MKEIITYYGLRGGTVHECTETDAKGTNQRYLQLDSRFFQRGLTETEKAEQKVIKLHEELLSLGTGDLVIRTVLNAPHPFYANKSPHI